MSYPNSLLSLLSIIHFFLFLFDFINGSRSNRMCFRFCWSHGNEIVISDTHTLLWFDDANPTRIISILYTGRWVALPQPTIDCFGIGSVLVRMLCNCTIYLFFVCLQLHSYIQSINILLRKTSGRFVNVNFNKMNSG